MDGRTDERTDERGFTFIYLFFLTFEGGREPGSIQSFFRGGAQVLFFHFLKQIDEQMNRGLHFWFFFPNL